MITSHIAPRQLSYDELIEGAAQSAANTLGEKCNVILTHPEASTFGQSFAKYIRSQPGWRIMNVDEPGGAKGWDGEKPWEEGETSPPHDRGEE